LSRVAKPISYALIFILFFTLLGFRVTHPKSGLRSAAGAADTSIVAYRSSDNLSRGDKVVIRLEKSSISPAIGIVDSIEDDSIRVQTGDLLLSVPREAVKGKLIGVFPFIGTLFTIVGL
jgi:hypothetical protein